MKNAKEIKFERSLDSYKSMNQIKKIQIFYMNY